MSRLVVVSIGTQSTNNDRFHISKKCFMTMVHYSRLPHSFGKPVAMTPCVGLLPLLPIGRYAICKHLKVASMPRWMPMRKARKACFIYGPRMN